MKSLEKSQVQQLVHGIQYKPRNKEPSMFEILSWNQNLNQNHIITENANNQNQYENNTNKKLNNNIKTVKSHNKLTTLEFNQSPHKYKHELYLYNDQNQKNINKNTQNQQQNNMNNNKKLSKAKSQTFYKSKQQITLNPNNVSDRQEIQKRKKKIKQFKLFSRQLPDSAFTTYFGKPAFSNYGSGSKSLLKKSFNIMPHAGSNHPEYKQSYQTALSRGKQIKQNYVPKKPLEIYHPSQQNMVQSDYYSIPINKPNLINTVRFSQDKKYLQRKGATPKHNQINRLPKRHYIQNTIQTDYSNKKNLKKVTSQKTFQTLRNQHPLVVSRDNLRQILAQKKKQQNRLAYKVTQCYPLPYQNCQKDCQTKVSRWSQMKPAGIVSPRSDHVQDVFYKSNVWN